jgi:hypothetical protein
MKIYKKIVLPFLLTSLLTFSGCFDGSDSETETQEVETKGNYSIAIPQNWEIFPESEFEKNMIFAAREGEYDSSVPVTITISHAYSLPQSLDTLIQKNFEIIRKQSQDFKIISEEKFTTQEIEKEQTTDKNTGAENTEENKTYINPDETRTPDSKLVIYTEKYTTTNSFAKIYSLNVLSYKENKTYVVNILSDINETDEKKELIRNILQSFTITL